MISRYCSDHYQPWLDAQGHAGYAWAILGAAAHATERIGLMSYVTCPIIRYHPAIVAQKAATVQILSGGRFRLGLGAGENLNEHVVGQPWPSVGQRHEMLEEAVEIIDALFGSDSPVQLPRTLLRRGNGQAVGPPRPARADRDGLLGTGVVSPGRPQGRHPRGHRAQGRARAALRGEGGAGKPKVGQIALCYDADREAAVQRAHDQFRWFGLGWKVNADLPNPDGFEGATQFIDPDQVASALACGADLEEHVEKIRPFIEAGFDEVALVQIGAEHQDVFFDWAQEKLLPALRTL